MGKKAQSILGFGGTMALFLIILCLLLIGVIIYYIYLSNIQYEESYKEGMTYLNNLSINATLAEEILNWALPILGVIFAGLIIWFIWRYVRRSDHVGRISEFDEKALKKIIKEKGDKEHIPFCEDCKMPMRMEIRYKDFMKDQGEFLVSRETAEHTLTSLLGNERITQDDMDLIVQFFEKNPELDQHLFRRYKCPNCSKTQVLPYHKSTE